MSLPSAAAEGLFFPLAGAGVAEGSVLALRLVLAPFSTPFVSKVEAGDPAESRSFAFPLPTGLGLGLGFGAGAGSAGTLGTSAVWLSTDSSVIAFLLRGLGLGREGPASNPASSETGSTGCDVNVSAAAGVDWFFLSLS